jgi:serine/threonine protein kinase
LKANRKRTASTQVTLQPAHHPSISLSNSSSQRREKDFGGAASGKSVLQINLSTSSIVPNSSSSNFPPISPARIAFRLATPAIDFPEQDPNVRKMDRYKEIRVVGRGNYGTAHLVKDLQTGRKLVVKKIPMAALSDKERKEAGLEIQLLSKLSHPNVVQYVTSFLEDEVLHIVTAFCSGGDLAQVIKTRRDTKAYLDEEAILDIFIQLAMAVDYCHSLRVMHRDLKASNVFITRKNVVKLGDFGIAKMLDEDLNQARTVVGTPFYMSPEVCENKPYDFKSDVWAMGCILYELCTLEHAFGASNLLAVVSKIVQEQPAPIPEFYSEELRSLVGQLLTKDPKERPSAKAIFKMPFIRERLEALAKSNGLPDLGQEDDDDGSTIGTSSGHYRRDSLMTMGKSKSMELKSSDTGPGANPPLPMPKIRRSNSQLSHLDNLSNSVISSPPVSRRESPPNTNRVRHHSRSRSSIVVRAADEEFASSPVLTRERVDSEEIDRNDARLVLDELRLRSEGVERTSTEFGSGRRTSHARSNSTIGTTGRNSGASASSATPSRHSRTGSSVTALSLDT